MNLDEIFLQSYLKEYTEREKKKIIHSQEERAIAMEKRKKLKIMEEFLQKFVDLEIIVNNKDQYTKNTFTMEGMEPKKFEFYLVDSSKTWSPGISIFFDHPCEVEIAIPNKPEEEGVVIIKVASHHPDAHILEQKFYNFESACKALARFLSKCTVKIVKDPRKYIKDVKENLQKKNNESLAHNISDEPLANNSIAPVVLEKKANAIKDSSDSLSLKKIGEFFNLAKTKEEDENEDY